MSKTTTNRKEGPFLYDAVLLAMSRGLDTKASLCREFPNVSPGSMASCIRALRHRGHIPPRGKHILYQPITDEQTRRGEEVYQTDPRVCGMASLVLRTLDKRGPLRASQLSLVLERPLHEITDCLTDMVDAGSVSWIPGMNAETSA